MKNEPTPMEWKNINGFVSSSTHAEMNAILNYLSRTKRNAGRRERSRNRNWGSKMPSTIAVVNIDRGDRFKNSRPCDHCLCLLRYYGVRSVVYSTGSEDPADAFRKEKISDMEFMGSSGGNRRRGYNIV